MLNLYDQMLVSCVIKRFFVAARPWLFDDFEEWLERMRGEPHKCAVVFVDNSGIDIIVGVFPFVRELLNRGTQVQTRALIFTTNIHCF